MIPKLLKSKPRKPPTLRLPGFAYDNGIVTGAHAYVDVGGQLEPDEARKIAAWLLKYADWAEYQEGEKT